jgi:Asp-tRNA(Asn)/Glu-tRNA(Gln) amidotransferase A subunit family amidase
MADMAHAFRDVLDRFADTHLVFPVHPLCAPSHDVPLLLPLNISYTCVFNVAESPATSVPMGLDTTSGVPTGVQIVGARGADLLTIAAAEAALALALVVWLYRRKSTLDAEAWREMSG